ncbi:MAG TPA: YncE family protein [Burkholderiaceae bacterium]|nr:YncE family protein [Burkholderiaceae bacterium]
MSALRFLFLLPLCAAALAALPEYRVTAQLPVAGPVRWDCVFVDQRAHRLYVAQGTQTDVIDTTRDTLVGTIRDTHGVHDIAVANELGLVFTSNGADNEIGVYDLATRRPVRSIKTGTNPDAIVYEPASQRIVAFNGRSHDITVADARTGTPVGAAIPVGGKPELAVADGRGLVYFNIEDTAEVAALDARNGKLVRRYSIAPCDSPTGLDVDPQGRLYSACANGLMVVSDPVAGKVIGQAGIGAGPDGVAWLDGYAISANGRDGTASVIGETTPGHFETLATVTVAPGARTIAADRDLHKLYLPTADLEPEAPVAPGQKAARRQPIAGTFKVIVVGAH